jgi:hypothetical protein
MAVDVRQHDGLSFVAAVDDQNTIAAAAVAFVRYRSQACLQWLQLMQRMLTQHALQLVIPNRTGILSLA